jgi:anaerobic selenocysteine-containing dehydrogenase/Fe-S-cluster-containing dehydrogenase component
MNRRTFLKLVGMGSMSIAAGCSPEYQGGPYPHKTLFSLVQAPDDMVIGKPTWYASTCRECPAGCGVLAKNREGRVIKVEGNPQHPINRGRLCMRGQAALQAIYNPDRIKTPLLKEGDRWRPIPFAEALSLLRKKTDTAARAGKNRVRLMTEVVGENLLKLFEESLDRWNSDGPLVFEPFAYEALKVANEKVFGVKGLPSYQMDQADALVSFGADFLETWLSPVEYARKFKDMHALQAGRKGAFVHISPYRSLTGANADLWLACRPGSQAVVALALIGELLHDKRAEGLPAHLRQGLEKAAGDYTKEKAAESAGIPLEQLEQVIETLKRASKPLVLGTETAAGPGALQTDLAANYLDLILDPRLELIGFAQRHRVEIAASRSEVLSFFQNLDQGAVDVLLLNNVNPVYAIPSSEQIEGVLKKDSLFVVSFANFMDDTSSLADLVIPVGLPLEVWDEYGGKNGIVATLQPAMGSITAAPNVGDLFLETAFGKTSSEESFKAYLMAGLVAAGRVHNELEWLRTLQRGGIFDMPAAEGQSGYFNLSNVFAKELGPLPALSETTGLTLVAAPSIRFFDGRGANRPWLCEVPDPVTRVAWQTPLLVHPDVIESKGLEQGDLIRIKSGQDEVEAPVYASPWLRPDVMVMSIGQGHTAFGRYAAGKGANPLRLMPAETVSGTGGPLYAVAGVDVKKTGRKVDLAHTDGNRDQHGRKIALTVSFDSLDELKKARKAGLTMWDFPLTLPLPEGYDPKRDFYPPIHYEAYRWSMVVDLDRCIGCGACAAACYAENNLGIVFEERIVEGREMAWLTVVRYEEQDRPEHILFLPLMCQHCDNAPCESVCPVYAPHHNREGMNNQIYNRCIGTRFCSQNCPYKVRRFNWFDWKRTEPLNLQLNPDVTVRSKGVMEKCSFCVQRIKEAHGWAKNEKRAIRDGEVIPACVQTCPTDALTFGNLMDPDSRVRKLVDDPRAYQIMGYLNTKPAVIYLKKVVQQV